MNMDVVICNFQRLAQHKNPLCAEGSGGHSHNPRAHCPLPRLDWEPSESLFKEVQFSIFGWLGDGGDSKLQLVSGTAWMGCPLGRGHHWREDVE